MLCLLDYPSHLPLLGVAISRKRVSWCVRSTRLDDYGHLTSSCRRHRPACSAYRLMGNTYCTLFAKEEVTVLTTFGCQLLVSFFEAPVFPPALLHTTAVPHGGVNTKI